MKLKSLCFSKPLKAWETSEYFPVFFFFTIRFITVENKYISRNHPASLYFLRARGHSVCFKNVWDFVHGVVINCWRSHVLTLFLKVLPLNAVTTWFGVSAHFLLECGETRQKTITMIMRFTLISIAGIKLPVSPNVKVQNWWQGFTSHRW